ncbi:MAG: hypothetical protein ABI183_26735, partial [Polyangiaceae bacterium]
MLGLITLGAAAGSGCTKDPVVDQRVVTLYTLEDPPNAITPSSCAVPSDSFALYTAAGDFQPDIDSPPQSSVRLNELSPQLSAIPSSTRQLTLAVGPTTNPWRGYELIPATGDIAVLLWPAGHECELKPSVDARPGSTITPYDDRHVLIAGGVNSSSFIADLSNGSVAQLGLSQEITTPRAFASATKFSGGVVIAGGDYGNAPTSDAEIFSSQSSSFTGESINLGVPRALQGATLLTNGNILLVGGETNATTLYPSLELIDPVLKRATQAGLPQLDSPRANPTVLTLTSGEVLVAGGVDASGSAVRSVEWFSKDASANIGQASIAASHHQAFVALPAGGALGVVSSDTTGVTTTWVITSDHQIQQGASLATVLPGSNIRLFPGANGAPLLWTGSNWFRWSPWTGAFVPFSDATSNGTTLANGPSEAAVTASPDPGLALWLENAQGVTAGKVLGLRFDSRGEYSTDVETLLSGDTTSIAPDRLPGSDLSFQEAIANGPATGLALGPNAQAVIADANYLNFSLDFDSGELEMPTLILRNATENDFTIGEDSAVTCGLPLNANHVHVERNGSVVSV